MVVLDLAVRMNAGAAAHGAPAPRRDKLQATAKAIKRLQGHLGDFDLQTIANALGRTAPAPTTMQMLEQALETNEPQIVPFIPSQTPRLIEAYQDMLATLAQLRNGITALADTKAAARRGADETPDSLLFAVQGLAAVWQKFKGLAPANFSLNKGEFGGFAVEALALCGDVFAASAVKTAIRRVRESQRSR